MAPMTSPLPFAKPKAGLAVREVPARTKALMAEHERLLQRAATKRAEIARLTEENRDAHSKLAPRLVSLIEEAARLSKQTIEAFEALLRDPKRSKRQKKLIREIFQEVLDSGLLMDPREAGGEGEGEADGEPVEDFDDEPRFVEPAEARPAGQSHGDVRALFRKLADAFHPDKVQDDAERARRTEVMKKITAAYQAGDFARLVELERTYRTEQAPTDVDPDEHHARLSSAVRVLRKQVRALDKELRAARAQKAGGLPRVVDEAELGVSELRRVHEHVATFRDGKLDFAAFCAGPRSNVEGGDVDANIADALVESLLSSLANERGTTRRPAGPRSGARGARGGGRDIPF
jgi:hypothetical protein